MGNIKGESESMKKIALITISLLCSIVILAQDIKGFVGRQLHIGTIDQMQLGLPYYQQDKAFIDSILSVGRYAISHSPEYREAYHPHYRIVERGIFERELKPLIEKKALWNTRF